MCINRTKCFLFLIDIYVSDLGPVSVLKCFHRVKIFLKKTQSSVKLRQTKSSYIIFDLAKCNVHAAKNDK